jgi:hypothetical protein
MITIATKMQLQPNEVCRLELRQDLIQVKQHRISTETVNINYLGFLNSVECPISSEPYETLVIRQTMGKCKEGNVANQVFQSQVLESHIMDEPLWYYTLFISLYS